MIKVVAYCRYSSDNQREESIDAQIRAIKEFCTKHDYILTRTYIDEARSATSDDRPRFLDMIHEASEMDFELVIVHKLDRFARNRYDSAYYKKKLKEAGVTVTSVLENLDDSPESVILESVLEGMAEYYSKNLARKVKKGQKENALKAKHNGGTPPLGYDVKDSTYIINDHEANSVKLIYKWYLDGYDYAAIASKLNHREFKSKAGRPFVKNSIRDILLNEKYTGMYIYNKGTINEIRVADGLPQIIEVETYNAVQRKVKSRVRGPRMRDENVYYLSGLMKCGECGGPFSGDGYVNGRSKVYYQYGCASYRKNKSCMNTQLRKELIEDTIIEQIVLKFFTDDAIDTISSQLVEYLKSEDIMKKTEQKRLNNLKASTQSKIDKLFNMFYQDLIDPELLSAQMDKLKSELISVNERIAILLATDNAITKEMIMGYLRLNKARLDEKDPEIKRKVITTFVSEIRVYTDRIDVDFKCDILVRGKVGGAEGNHKDYNPLLP